MRGAHGTGLSLLLLIFTVFLYGQGRAQDFVTITTTNGTVRGIRESVGGNSVVLFLGIPYATPPLRELRFQKPEPAKNWTGIKNATGFGDACMSGFPVSSKMSENCLTLNIYQPDGVVDKDGVVIGNATTKSVMVWIHGGGYRSGASSEYDFRQLATAGDVIVVSINYRLGALGFLSLEDALVSGNQGLWDQIQALMWVQDNIGYFGGDSNTVTIFGESAGGASVSQLALTTATKGLFQRVISQSGVATASWSWTGDCVTSAEKLGDMLGCTDTNKMALLACLRSSDADALTNASLLVPPPSGRAYTFSPSIDGDMFKSPVSKILQNPGSEIMRRFLSLDYMGGFLNSDGGISLIFAPFDISEGISPDTLRDRLIPNLAGSLSSKFKGVISKEITEVYVNDTADNLTTAGSYVDIMTDVSFSVVTVQLLASHASLPADVRGSTYLYYLNNQPSFPHVLQGTPKWLHGANHADDLPYLVGENSTSPDSRSFTPAEQALSRAMMTYWSNFAKTGNPNQPTSLSAKWPRFASVNGSYMELADTIKAGDNLLPERLSLWFQILQLITSGGTTPQTPMTSTITSTRKTTTDISAASAPASVHIIIGLVVQLIFILILL